MTNLPVPSPANSAAGQLVTNSWFTTNVVHPLQFYANPPLSSAYQNSAQSIPNNTTPYTAITFDTVSIDTYGGWTSTSVYTAQVAGYYSIDAQCGFSTNTTGYRGLQLLLNGTGLSQATTFVAPTSGYTTPTLSGYIVYCNAGDTISIGAYQNSGAALSLVVGRSSVSILWVHA